MDLSTGVCGTPEVFDLSVSILKTEKFEIFDPLFDFNKKKIGPITKILYILYYFYLTFNCGPQRLCIPLWI